MKTGLALLLLCLGLSPVAAEGVLPEAPVPDLGQSLMQHGAQMLLRGLMHEMEPALNDMGKAMGEIEPVLRDLIAMMDDLRNYHAPVLLPNGDILIRRKTPAELALPEIEL